MLRARPAKEVVLRMPNAIGTLNAVAKTVADEGVNILGVTAWVEGADVVMRLFSDDAARTADVLRAQKHAVREVDVVVMEVPNRPGMLRRITDYLVQDEIDIHHLYATSAAGLDQALVVFATANNDRAIERLNGTAPGAQG
jgi:hypothetical protein